MKYLIALIFTVSAFGQSSVSLARQLCSGSDGTKTRVLIVTPIASIPVPICAVLGSTLKLNMSAPGGPSIDVANPAATVLLPQVEAINLDPAVIPTSTTTLNYALAKAPAANTFLVVVFRSASYPGDTVEIVANPQQQLIISLPLLRSQGAGDTIQLRYFSTN